jgi:hypothetical protein
MPSSKKTAKNQRRKVALSELEQQLERGVNYKNIELTDVDRARIETEIANLKNNIK